MRVESGRSSPALERTFRLRPTDAGFYLQSRHRLETNHSEGISAAFGAEGRAVPLLRAEIARMISRVIGSSEILEVLRAP
ncbi:hypothetical protein Y590_02595 [Methylobacterium sp. AMS5]|nr:hypothetical protein Y590_02595 [Methylobacterium sp. AMS5]